MTKYLLLPLALFITGCSYNSLKVTKQNNTTQLNISQDSKISVKDANHNFLQRAYYNPNRHIDFDVINTQMCKIISYEATLTNKNHYYIYNANDDLKMKDKSCISENVNNINYSVCNSGYYIDTSTNYWLGYNKKLLIYTDNKECFDNIKDNKTIISTPKEIDIQKEYDDFNNQNIITTRYERIREDSNRKIVKK